MIELSGFSKKYSDKSDFVVKGINLKAEKGTVTGLLGLNGAGKTTIIKAICGIHYATEGKIFISNDNNCYEISDSIVDVKKLISYVPENFSLPEALKTSEYLRFIQNIYNDNKDFKSKEKRFIEILSICELNSVSDKKIRELSKGFKQRILLAHALLTESENIILDEPVNGLDPAQIIQFRKIIKNASKSKTVFVSTHLMQEVEALCDYIYILHNGCIAEKGTKDEIKAKYNCSSIEDAFLKITGES